MDVSYKNLENKIFDYNTLNQILLKKLGKNICIYNMDVFCKLSKTYERFNISNFGENQILLYFLNDNIVLVIPKSLMYTNRLLSCFNDEDEYYDKFKKIQLKYKYKKQIIKCSVLLCLEHYDVHSFLLDDWGFEDNTSLYNAIINRTFSLV